MKRSTTDVVKIGAPVLLAVLLACICLAVLPLHIGGIAFAAGNEEAEDNAIMRIQNYLRDDFASNIAYNEDAIYRITVGGDDPIVDFVPKELFATEGKHLYIGRDIGYFIHTFRDGYLYQANWIDLPAMRSYVMLFTTQMVEGDEDKTDTKDKINYYIEVLMQREYAFLPAGGTQYDVGGGDFTQGFEQQAINWNIFRWNTYKYTREYTVADGIENNEGFVVPVPHRIINKHIFDDVDIYYLHDVEIGVTIANAQDYNTWDAEYDVENDSGSFVTSSGIDINAYERVKTNDDVIGALENAAYFVGKKALDVALGAIPLLGDIAGTALDIVEYLKSSQGYFGTDTLQPYDMGDGYGTSENPNTKKGQMDVTGGYLYKSAYIGMSERSGVDAWLGVGCFFNGIVRVSNSTGNESGWRTVVYRTISASVSSMFNDVESVRADSEIYVDAFNNYREKSLREDTETHVYTLAPQDASEGKDVFAFTADRSGYYDIVAGSADVEINITDENDNVVLPNELGYFLTEDMKYIIEVLNKTDDNVKTSIKCGMTVFDCSSVADIEFRLPENSSVAVKINIDSPQCYTVLSGNDNITAGIYIFNEQGVFVEYKPGDFDWTASPSITFPFLQGEYYIVLHNTGEEALSASVSFDGVPDITEGRNEIDFGNNWAYFRFIPDESDYIVTLSADAMFAQMELYNQDMRRVSAVSGSMIFSVKDLTVGDEYYIAVRSNDTEYASGALTVKPQETAFAWYVDGVRVNGNNISLERCWAYNIEFRINDDLIYRSFYQSSGDGSTSYFAHNADNETNIGIPQDVPLDTIVHLKAAFNDELEYIYGLYVRVVSNTKIVIDEMVSYENSVKAYIIVNEPNISEIEYNVSYSGLFGGDYAFSDSAQVSLDENKTMCIEFPIDNYLIGNTMFRVKKIKYKGNWYNFSSEAAESGFSMMLAKGDGTEENPYVMNCERHYAMFLLVASAGYDSKDFYWKLDADISLTNHVMPEQFYGHFDGGGHTLSGMTIDIPAESYASIEYFGWVGENHGTIRNVTFSNVSIYAPIWHEGAGVRIGIVAGVNASDGIIENVILEECVIDTNRNDASIGGFAGVNDGVIRNCTVGTLIDLGELSIFGNGDAGFICGTNTGVIDGCQICWAVMEHYPSVNNRSVGTAVGYCTDGTIKNCQLVFCVIEVTGCDAGIVPNIGKFIGHVTSRVQLENNVFGIIMNLNNLPEGQRGHCCAAGDDGAYGYYENV